VRKHEHLFGTSAEHEGVSAFEAHDALALSRCTHHQPIDGVLFDARATRSLANAETLRARETPQRFSIDQRVIEHEVGFFHAPKRANRPQLRIPRTGTHKRNSTYWHGLTPTPRLRSGWPER
jgi:hypothetical protein